LAGRFGGLFSYPGRTERGGGEIGIRTLDTLPYT
jgi:hypothetical protein